jgi:hypothetical protein
MEGAFEGRKRVYRLKILNEPSAKPHVRAAGQLMTRPGEIPKQANRICAESSLICRYVLPGQLGIDELNDVGPPNRCSCFT